MQILRFARIGDVEDRRPVRLLLAIEVVDVFPLVVADEQDVTRPVLVDGRLVRLAAVEVVIAGQLGVPGITARRVAGGVEIADEDEPAGGEGDPVERVLAEIGPVGDPAAQGVLARRRPFRRRW